MNAVTATGVVSRFSARFSAVTTISATVAPVAAPAGAAGAAGAGAAASSAFTVVETRHIASANAMGEAPQTRLRAICFFLPNSGFRSLDGEIFLLSHVDGDMKQTDVNVAAT
ncbi:MAG: hypothetical protein JO111_13040 [Caulobacteraceae bacterium]|nr:hypothetical protein [Caulobacteraceae bacterium]